MSEQDDLLAKLRETLNSEGIDSFHILEELVPIEEQMEYFKNFEQLKRKDVAFDRDNEIAILFSPDASLERKKRALSLLASIPDVGAYRSIETYHSSPLEPELRNWSSLALVSSRIILSSDLSGHQQIYISSGLGGHDKKLRFFALFTSKHRKPFSELQREIIDREFRFQLNAVDAEIEKLQIEENYFTILLLFSFQVDIRAKLNNATAECNQYGDFIDSNFLLTNVKVLSEDEIKAIIDRQ